VLTAVSISSGLSAADVALHFGLERTAASGDEILAADDIQAVVIATWRGSHAALTTRALGADKAVFVETPLALDADELAEVESALTDDAVLMVGFNRRFVPLTEALRAAGEDAPECALLARVNAGPLPRDDWLHDAVEDGGRLLGEGGHLVDLLCHVVGSPPLAVQAMAVPQPERPLECIGWLVAAFRFLGVVGTFVCSGGGDPRLPKEWVEAFGGWISAVLDDFRRLKLYRHGKHTILKRSQDKGHRAQFACSIAAAAGLFRLLLSQFDAPDGCAKRSRFAPVRG
jgi:predicted dehydrogenase